MFISANFSTESGLKQNLDFIYARSEEGKGFHGLIEVISNPITITTAIHNIKSNKGSHTAGLDNKNINYYLQMSCEKLIGLVQKSIENYNPKPVRRVYIDKGNGKMRPLGIPTMLDRIIQECIRIVLEPIVEAKFYPHSYGFRPLRDCKDAITYAENIIKVNRKDKPIYAIEGDIKGFFDNINHHKLLKTLQEIGVYDKRVLMIIKKMLKAGYFEGEIHETELGTPQGGILSPLLANVYLNNFDWTIWHHREGKNAQKGREQSSKPRELYQSTL
jgi:RNA-directed DNA polymerase